MSGRSEALAPPPPPRPFSGRRGMGRSGLETLRVATAVTRDRIKFYDAYAAADHDAFMALLTFLREDGFVLDPERSSLTISLPTLDKLSWRPDVRELACNTDGGRSIAGLSIVHHAMHGLVASRYGSTLRGRPWLSLLSEALASCTQLYFSLKMEQMLAAHEHEEASAIRLYRRVGSMLGVDVEATLKAALASPFDAYRRAVKGMMAVYQEIIAFDRRIADGDATARASQLDEKLRAMPEFLFIRTYDYGNNVLYTKTFCGLESDEDDHRSTTDCDALLDRAASLVELVKALRAQYLRDAAPPTCPFPFPFQSGEDPR